MEKNISFRLYYQDRREDKMEPRIATINRITRETDITLTLNLDGSGKCDLQTGIAFFDHMLNGFARHGLFDLDLAKAIWKLIPIIRWRTAGLYWEKQLKRQSGKKGRLNDTEAQSFPWMRHWYSVPLICLAGHTFHMMQNSRSPG